MLTASDWISPLVDGERTSNGIRTHQSGKTAYIASLQKTRACCSLGFWVNLKCTFSVARIEQEYFVECPRLDCDLFQEQSLFKLV